MTLQLDPRIAAALAPILEHAGEITPPPAGDVDTRRVALNGMLAAINNLEAAPADVTTTDYHLTTPDGADLLLRWYTKNGTQPGSAVLYFHGGGLILGSVAMWDGPVSRIVSAAASRSSRSNTGLPRSTRSPRRSRTPTRRCNGCTVTPKSSVSIRPASRSWATAPVAAWQPRSRSWPATAAVPQSPGSC